MTTSNIYEIFNDFLAFKDPTQILGLAEHLEVFASPTLSDGKIYTGADAPEAFRQAMKRHADAKRSTVKLGTTQRTGDDQQAVFVSEVKGKKGSNQSAISIVTRGGSLIGFVEAAST